MYHRNALEQLSHRSVHDFLIYTGYYFVPTYTHTNLHACTHMLQPPEAVCELPVMSYEVIVTADNQPAYLGTYPSSAIEGGREVIPIPPTPRVYSDKEYRATITAINDVGFTNPNGDVFCKLHSETLSTAIAIHRSHV